MLKFDFAVNTRDGQKVESIQIQGKDLPDAERKLFQMYPRSCFYLHLSDPYFNLLERGNHGKQLFQWK